MGDRGNIVMEYEPRPHLDVPKEDRVYPRDFDEPVEIYFYSHWGGSVLPMVLAYALDRGRGRWEDEAYLARIIFSEMIQNAVMEETGFGIAPYAPDNEHNLLVVRAWSGWGGAPKLQTVNNVGFEDFIGHYLGRSSA